MALTPDDIAYGLSHGAPARWRLTSVDRRGNPVGLGGTGNPDLTSALLYERGDNPGLEGGSLSMDHGREVVTEASLRLLLDRVPGGLDALDHLRLTEVRRIQPRGGRELRYRTALDRALTLGLDGLWALSEATGDAIDLSGHGNDGTVQYAEGQRAVLPPLYDRGLPGMRFLRGTRNYVPNPVAGVNTTGWSTSNTTITRLTGQAIQHPDGFEIDTCFRITAGAVANSNLMFGDFAVTADGDPTDPGEVWTGQFLVRAPEGSSAIGKYARLLMWETGGPAGQSMVTTATIQLSTDWTLIQGTGTVSQAGRTSLQLYVQGLANPSSGMFTSGDVIEVVAFQAERGSSRSPIAVGDFGTGYSFLGTAHASDSERVPTMVTVPNSDEIENIWAVGATASVMFEWSGPGEPAQRLIDKGAWLLYLGADGALYAAHSFSGSTAQWRAQLDLVQQDTRYIATLEYDNTSVANDAVIRVYNRDTGEEVPVTMTEVVAPVGTAISDAAFDLIIGNRAQADRTFNGLLALACVARRILTDEEIDELFALTHEAAQYLGPAPEPEDAEFPQTIFRPSFSDTLYPWDGHNIVGLTLHDNTVHTLDTTGVALSYPAGTGYWAVLRDIIETHLGLLTDLPPGDGPPLPQDFSRPASWRWIDVLRDLTDGRNRYPVWPDLLGRMTTRERINPVSESPAVHYAETLEPRMLDAGAPYVRKGNVPLKDNRRVAVAGFGATHITPQYVIYENADPGSPVSTAHTPPRLDRLRDDSRPSTRAVFDLATLRALAQYELRSLAAEAEPVTFDTFPDPRRQPRESYLVTVVGAETAQLVRVQRWSRALKAGAPMTHEADIVRPVTLTEIFEIEEEV